MTTKEYLIYIHDIIFRMNYVFLGLRILAGFGFLFQSYRLLVEDYPEKQVVKASVLGLIFSTSFIFLSNYFNLNLVVLFLILTAVLVIYLFKAFANWHFWSVLETITWPGLICLSLAYAGEIKGLIFLSAVILSFYWKNYRSFSWYPSGKVGFFFLVNLSFISLFLVGLDFWEQRLVELSVWSISFFAGVGGIILLSTREQRD